jgi:purine-binding chemotaxis protein CheW
MDIAKIRKKLKKGGEKKTGRKSKKPDKSSQPEDISAQIEKSAENAPAVETHKKYSVPQKGEKEPAEEFFFDDPYADEYEDDVSRIEMLAFKVSGQDYAFRVPEVKEILRGQSVTPVPGSSRYILGITSIRGLIIPVVDLGRRLMINEKQEYGERAKIIVATGPKGSIGVLVGSSVNVLAVPEEDFGDVPESLSAEESFFLDSVARVDRKQFVFLINTDRLFDFSGEMEAR